MFFFTTCKRVKESFVESLSSTHTPGLFAQGVARRPRVGSADLQFAGMQQLSQIPGFGQLNLVKAIRVRGTDECAGGGLEGLHEGLCEQRVHRVHAGGVHELARLGHFLVVLRVEHNFAELRRQRVKVDWALFELLLAHLPPEGLVVHLLLLVLLARELCTALLRILVIVKITVAWTHIVLFPPATSSSVEFPAAHSEFFTVRTSCWASVSTSVASRRP